MFASTVAIAESGPFNIHVEPAVTAPVPPEGFLGVGAGATLKLDVAITSLLAVQAQGFTMVMPRDVRLTNIYGAGLGMRVRLLNDHGGFRFRPKGSTKGGNWFGNVWFDGGLILTGTNQLNRLGLDTGIGVELSLFEGLQTGPFVKFTYADGLPIPSVGVSISLGADAEEEGPADLDKDGVLDAADKCVNAAEDKDQFKDEDGCPDPDNDGDNLVDDRDKCPNEAEDKDGTDDDDGCPDGDNDADGIADEKDKCPTEPEDKDGVDDEDGCADKDDDKDGIEEPADKCPKEAEDKDGFQDDDGCIDADNDGDDIPDTLDRCPAEPETYNGNADEDGCPEKEARVFVTKDHVVITDKIYFATGKATIEKRSNALLDSVAAVFKQFPQLKKVQIEGHTDDVGDEKFNQKLSEDRAKAVKDYLVKAGVEAARLESKGFGKSKPVDTATTDEAREKNRRVEFLILEPQNGIIETLHHVHEGQKPPSGAEEKAP